MKPLPKNMTLDDLAALTQQGFVELEEKLTEKIDSKIDGLRTEMDIRFKAVDKRFDQMDERFDKLEFRVGGYDRRLERLEDKMMVVNVKLGIN